MIQRQKADSDNISHLSKRNTEKFSDRDVKFRTDKISHPRIKQVIQISNNLYKKPQNYVSSTTDKNIMFHPYVKHRTNTGKFKTVPKVSRIRNKEISEILQAYKAERKNSHLKREYAKTSEKNFITGAKHKHNVHQTLTSNNSVLDEHVILDQKKHSNENDLNVYHLPGPPYHDKIPINVLNTMSLNYKKVPNNILNTKSSNHDSVPNKMSPNHNKVPNTMSSNHNKVPNKMSSNRNKVPNAMPSNRNKVPNTMSSNRNKVPNTMLSNLNKVPKHIFNTMYRTPVAVISPTKVKI